MRARNFSLDNIAETTLGNASAFETGEGELHRVRLEDVRREPAEVCEGAG